MELRSSDTIPPVDVTGSRRVHRNLLSPFLFHGETNRSRQPDSHAITIHFLTHGSKDTLPVTYAYYVGRTWKYATSTPWQYQKDDTVFRTAGIWRLRFDVLPQEWVITESLYAVSLGRYVRQSAVTLMTSLPPSTLKLCTANVKCSVNKGISPGLQDGRCAFLLANQLI